MSQPLPPRPRIDLGDLAYDRATRTLGEVISTFFDESQDLNEDDLQQLDQLAEPQQGEVILRSLNNDRLVLAKETDVDLVDRAFELREAVEWMDARHRQVGAVVGVRRFVDLVAMPELQKLGPDAVPAFMEAVASGTSLPHIERNVDERRLDLYEPFAPDDQTGPLDLVLVGDHTAYTVHERVDSLLLYFLIDDSACIVEDCIDVRPVIANTLFNFVFWPGMLVTAPSRVLRDARWVRGNWSADKNAALVLEVGVHKLELDLRLTNTLVTPPYPIPESLDLVLATATVPVQSLPWSRKQPKGLKDLVVITADEQLHPNGYRITPYGVAYNRRPAIFCGGELPEPNPAVTDQEATAALRALWTADRRNAHSNMPNLTFKHVKMVVRTRTVVSVEWQDGTVTHNIDAALLANCTDPERSFPMPGSVVTRVLSGEQASTPTPETPSGVVVRASTQERLATVQWLEKRDFFSQPTANGPEEMSTYEIAAAPFWLFQPGSLCTRTREDGEVLPTTEQELWVLERARLLGHGPPPPLALSANIRTHSGRQWDGKPVPWIGEALGTLAEAGVVAVLWANNTYSLLRFEAALPVSMLGDDGADPATDGAELDTGDTDDPQWVTIVPPAGGEGEPEGDDSEWETDDEAEVVMVDDDNDNMDADAHAHEPEPEAEPGAEPDSQPVSMDVDAAPASSVASAARASAQQQKTMPDRKTPGAAAAEGLARFEQLESAPADHHFLSKTRSPLQDAGSKARRRRILQEYTSLASSLPEGVFVRTYENNLDIMRAAVMGPAGTPYQDVLFWFDFYMPPEFPHVPPDSFFYSKTDQWGNINPNLYTTGYVCLSLLNTWKGEGSERWSKDSSLLQVLVSLQGLVLVKYPYYNEPGYERLRGTTDNTAAILYNERVYMLAVKTAIAMLRHPPEDLAELAREYYVKRGVLAALKLRCENLIGDKQQKEDDGSAIFGEEPVIVNVSAGCKKILQGFVQAMAEILTTAAAAETAAAGGIGGM